VQKVRGSKDEKGGNKSSTEAKTTFPHKHDVVGEREKKSGEKEKKEGAFSFVSKVLRHFGNGPRDDVKRAVVVKERSSVGATVTVVVVVARRQRPRLKFAISATTATRVTTTTVTTNWSGGSVGRQLSNKVDFSRA